MDYKPLPGWNEAVERDDEERKKRCDEILLRYGVERNKKEETQSGENSEEIERKKNNAEVIIPFSKNRRRSNKSMQEERTYRNKSNDKSQNKDENQLGIF